VVQGWLSRSQEEEAAEGWSPNLGLALSQAHKPSLELWLIRVV
jgi:hypothetical protein